jgi:hypothetical protein
LGNIRSTCNILAGKPEMRDHAGDLGPDIRMDIK